MAQANQSDFFGEGTYDSTNGGAQAPQDPDDLPNPNNPGGISNNEYRRQLRAQQQKLAATPYGTPISQGGTAQGYQVSTQDGGAAGSQGVVARAGDFDPTTGMFTPTGRYAVGVYSPGGTGPASGELYDPKTGSFYRGQNVGSSWDVGTGDPTSATPIPGQTSSGLSQGAPPSSASGAGSAMNIPGASTTGVPVPSATANPNAVPTGTVDYSRYDQAAQGYQRAIDTFQNELDRLSGVDPFGNQAFLRKATDRAAAQAQGIAAGGLSTATARAGNMRQALNTAANISAQGRDQMAIQRQADQNAASQGRIAAAGGIANVVGQRAQNEVQLAQTETDAIQKNLDRALQGTEFAQKLTQEDVENLRQAAIAYSQIDQARYATDTQYRASVDQDITQRYMSDNTLQAAMAKIHQDANMTPKDWLLGAIGLGSGIAAGGAKLTSDRRAKFDVRDPDLRDLQDFLGNSKGKLYKYKEPNKPGRRPGLNFGPMAQDLAKSKIGRTVVSKDATGTYQVDTGRLALADHAALAELAREVRALKEASK